MITRRSLLTALASLPWIGRVLRSSHPGLAKFNEALARSPSAMDYLRGESAAQTARNLSAAIMDHRHDALGYYCVARHNAKAGELCTFDIYLGEPPAAEEGERE